MSVHTFFRPRPVLAVCAAAVIVFGAAACSGDDDNGEPDPANTTAAAEPTMEPTEAAPTGATGATGATGSNGAEATATPETSGAAESVSVELGEGDIGSYLVGPDGMTLYIFTEDAPNMTSCTGSCLDVWPPLLLEEGQEVEAGDGIDGDFDTIDTPSGTQVTYREAALYYFAGDSAEGDTNGHLVQNVWFVARPDTASTAYVNVSADGEYLVGPTGMTLYLFENDTEGVSNCSGECLTNWPALTVPEGMDPTAVDEADGELGTITREDDGSIQITYDGMPLYYFAADSVPGDTTGDGVGDVWVLATP